MSAPFSLVPDSYLEAIKAGVQVQAVRGELRVTGGDTLEDAEFDALVDALKAQKAEVIAFLRQSALFDLAELVRGHGLRFRHMAGVGTVPEYPRGWNDEDRAYVNSTLMASMPMEPVELAALIKLQRQTWEKKQ